MAAKKSSIKKLTQEVVKRSFFRYFFRREPVDTKHLLLSRLYPHESVVGSAIVGLQTSLGTTLWESLAKGLAELNEFKVLNPKEALLRPKKISKAAENLMAEWGRKREESRVPLPLSDFKKLMREIIKDSPRPKEFGKLGKGSGADLYFVKKGVKYVFDLKTVQLNAGSGSKYNKTLMEWITFDLFHNGATSNLKPMIAIPYDPTSVGDWWQLFGGRVAPLDHVDIQLGNEFWDFISGVRGTLEIVTDVFDEMIKTDFGKHYESFLTDYSMLAKAKHIEYQYSCSLMSKISQISNKKTKYEWRCNSCKSTLVLSMNKIFAEEIVCSKKTCI